MTYTATKWNTVEDKEKFTKHFKQFVEKGFPKSMFHKEFYNRMSIMRGHIAHYNQMGFFSTWFSTAEQRAKFLRLWIHTPIYGNPTYTWSDVEEVLCTWLQEHPEYLERERSAHVYRVESLEKAELVRLKAKYE